MWQSQMGKDYEKKVSFNHVPPAQDWYHLLQLNCNGLTFSATLDYVAVNPGGEYLSLAQVPFKTLCSLTMGLWTGLMIIWVSNWYRYRFFNIKLQSLLTVVPLCRTVSSCVNAFYWRQASLTGYFPKVLEDLRDVVEILYLGVFFISILLLSKGWMISRAELPLVERWRACGMVTLLIVSQSTYNKVGGFVLFFVVVMYVVLLRYIFANIVENLTMLTSQIQLLRDVNLNFNDCPASIKLLTVIFHLWAAIFLSSMPWVDQAMEHVITGALVVSVGWTFGMRPFRPYYYRIADSNDMLEEAGGESQMPVENMQPWRPGMPVPKLPSDFRSWLLGPTQADDTPVLIVQCPEVNEKAGTSRVHISVAMPCVPSYLTKRDVGASSHVDILTRADSQPSPLGQLHSSESGIGILGTEVRTTDSDDDISHPPSDLLPVDVLVSDDPMMDTKIQ
eukprot:g65323.t1